MFASKRHEAINAVPARCRCKMKYKTRQRDTPGQCTTYQSYCTCIPPDCQGKLFPFLCIFQLFARGREKDKLECAGYTVGKGLCSFPRRSRSKTRLEYSKMGKIRISHHVFSCGLYQMPLRGRKEQSPFPTGAQLHKFQFATHEILYKYRSTEHGTGI